MDGNGVVDDRAHTLLLQALFQPITAMTAGQSKLTGVMVGVGGDVSRANRDTHHKLIPAMAVAC